MQFFEPSDDCAEARRPFAPDVVQRGAGAMPAKAERVLGALGPAPAPREKRDRSDHNDVDRVDVSLVEADKLARAPSGERDFVGPLNAASSKSRIPHISRSNTLPRGFTTAPVSAPRRIGNDSYDTSRQRGSSRPATTSAMKDMAWSRSTSALNELSTSSFSEKVAVSKSPSAYFESEKIVFSPEFQFIEGEKRSRKLDPAHVSTNLQTTPSLKARTRSAGVQDAYGAGASKTRLTGLRRLTDKGRFKADAITGTTSARRNTDLDLSPRTKIHVRRPPKNIKNWFDGFDISSDDEYEDEEDDDGDRSAAVEIGTSDPILPQELPADEPLSFRNLARPTFGLSATSSSPNMYSSTGRGSQQHFTHAYHSSEDLVQDTDQDYQRMKDRMHQALQRRHHVEMSHTSSTQSSSDWDDAGDSSSDRRLLSLTDGSGQLRSSSDLEGSYESPQSRRLVHRANTVPVADSGYASTPLSESVPGYQSSHRDEAHSSGANAQVSRKLNEPPSRSATPGAIPGVATRLSGDVKSDEDSLMSTPLSDASHIMAVTSEEMTLLGKMRQQRAAVHQHTFTEGYQLALKREQEHLARRRHSAQQTAIKILQMKEERLEKAKEARSNKIENMISEHAEQRRRIMLLQQENEHKAMKLEKFLLQSPGTVEQWPDGSTTRDISSPEPRSGHEVDLRAGPEILLPDVYSPRRSNNTSGAPTFLPISYATQDEPPPQNLEQELERGYHLISPQTAVWKEHDKDITSPPPYEEELAFSRLRSPVSIACTVSDEKSSSSFSARRSSFSNDGQSFDQQDPQNPHAIELPANEPVLPSWTDFPRGRNREITDSSPIDDQCLVSPLAPSVRKGAAKRISRSLSSTSIFSREIRDTAIFIPSLQATAASPTSPRSRATFGDGTPKLPSDLSGLAKERNKTTPLDSRPLVDTAPAVPPSINRTSVNGMVSASEEVSAAWAALGGGVEADGDDKKS